MNINLVPSTFVMCDMYLCMCDLFNIHVVVSLHILKCFVNNLSRVLQVSGFSLQIHLVRFAL